MKKIIYYWLPPILWMGFIFFLSSRTKISVSHDYLINFLFFKSLHMIEYAILFTLFFRAFFLQSKKHSLTQIFLASFIMASFFAITDEYHQTFVNSRQGTIRDIFIDIFGIFLMYIYIQVNLNFFKKIFLWKK